MGLAETEVPMRAAGCCAVCLILAVGLLSSAAGAGQQRKLSGSAPEQAAQRKNTLWQKLVRFPARTWQTLRSRVGGMAREAVGVRPASAEQPRKRRSLFPLGRWFDRLLHPFGRADQDAPRIIDGGPSLLDFDDDPPADGKVSAGDRGADDLRLPPLRVPSPSRDR